MLSHRERAAKGLKIGDCFTTSRTFTKDDILRFAEVSLDYNPVHFDKRFAGVKNFHAPVCHGLPVASLVTELGGQSGWLASSMNFRFKGPVYAGDTVSCTLEITSIDSRGRARASATLVNQNGGIVVEAEIGGIVPGDKERRVLRAMLSEGDPTNGPADRVGSEPGERGAG